MTKFRPIWSHWKRERARERERQRDRDREKERERDRERQRERNLRQLSFSFESQGERKSLYFFSKMFYFNDSRNKYHKGPFTLAIFVAKKWPQ
jgi:hypothetical protein